MEETRDKNLDAIAKLIKLTRDGKIIWESATKQGIIHGPEDVAESIYTTTYKDKNLRTYQLNYWSQNALLGFGSIFSHGNKTNRDKPIWTSKTVLEVINEDGRSLWTFPYTNMLDDLLKAIKYKSSGAADLIDSLLEE